MFLPVALPAMLRHRRVATAAAPATPFNSPRCDSDSDRFGSAAAAVQLDGGDGSWAARKEREGVTTAAQRAGGVQCSWQCSGVQRSGSDGTAAWEGGTHPTGEWKQAEKNQRKMVVFLAGWLLGCIGPHRSSPPACQHETTGRRCETIASRSPANDIALRHCAEIDATRSAR